MDKIEEFELSYNLDYQLVDEDNHYQVIVLNDDFTPMEFVVDVLIHVFGLNENKAVYVALQTHYNGSAACGAYPLESAQEKIKQAREIAQAQGHPLMCQLQPL